MCCRFLHTRACLVFVARRQHCPIAHVAHKIEHATFTRKGCLLTTKTLAIHRQTLAVAAEKLRRVHAEEARQRAIENEEELRKLHELNARFEDDVRRRKRESDISKAGIREAQEKVEEAQMDVKAASDQLKALLKHPFVYGAK